MTGESHKYWGFVSYSHHDKRVAKWLRSAIRKQRVPGKFRLLVDGGARRFDRLFFDEDDVSAADKLSDHLKGALESAYKLIVVCSPFSVASPIVEMEIGHFIAARGRENVICVGASGIPNASDDGKPQLECLPRPLRFEVDAEGQVTDRPIPPEHRPIVVALGEETPAELRAVRNQVAAGLLGITVRDYTGYQQSQALWYAAPAAALLLACVGVWDAYFRLTTEYYDDYVRRWGVWEGIGPLSSAEVGKRVASYKFVRYGRRNPPAEVSLVNSAGFCPEGPGIEDILDRDLRRNCAAVRACRMTFTYDGQGNILESVYRDQRGNALQRLRYAQDEVAEFKEAGFGCKRTKSGVQYVLFQRIESGPQNGFDRKVLFVNEKREPRANPKRVYGIQKTYTDEGRVTLKSFLDKAGNPRFSKDLVAQIAFSYNDLGQKKEQRFLDVEGRPISGKAGYAIASYEYDQYGNQKLVRYYDAARSPVSSRNGYAAIRYGHDAAGHLTDFEYLDAALQPTWHKYGYAVKRQEFDSRGQVTGRRFFGASGEPVIEKSDGDGTDGGCHHEAFVVGAFLENVEFRCFGPQGTPSFYQGDEGGFHGWRQGYDAYGNVTLKERFGPDGEPAFSKFGVHRTLNVYDERGRRVENLYFGTDNQPILNDEGFHGWMPQLDDAGNSAQSTYVGVDRRPVMTSRGYAIAKRKVDEYGSLVEIAYFDAQGAPSVNRHYRPAVHAVRFVDDSFGRTVEETYHDSTGRLMLDETGVAGARNTYDARGNLVQVTWLGTDGKPVLDTDGTAGWRQLYDARGNVIRFESIGLDGQAISSPNGGYHSWNAEYDERDQRVLVVFKDKAGRPFFYTEPDETSLGYAGYRQEFDVRGNIVKVTYLGEALQPAMRADTGYASRRNRYDFSDRLIEATYLDASDKPVEVKDDGVAAGYSGWRRQLDRFGNETERVLLNPNGQPASHAVHNYAIERSTYDNKSRQIATAQFGADGKPIENKFGIHQYTYKYDSLGYTTEKRFLGVDGQLTLATGSGRAMVRYEYDSQGRTVKEISLGLETEPVLRPDEEWSYKAMTYDSSGRLALTTYYDIDGAVLREERP